MTESSKSWWYTLPGVLTALAAIITAVTGLLLALNQADLIGGSGSVPESIEEPLASPSAETAPGGAHTAESVELESSGNALSGAQVRFPEGNSMRSGDLVYTVLAARVEPYAPESRRLAVDIRLTNNQSYPANFWNASFRLVVDGLLQAPTGDLNEVVDSNSSREGTVEFVVRSTVREAALQMGIVGENAPALPLVLTTGDG